MANPFYIPRRSNLIDIASLALNYAALKERGALTKRNIDIAEKGQELKKKESDILYGKDVITPSKRQGQIDTIKHIPGLKEREFAFKGRQIAIGEQANILAEQKEIVRQKGRLVMFNKEMSKPPDQGRLVEMADQYPAIAPMLNRIKGKINDDILTTKGQVYGEWKNLKARGLFEVAKADLIKSAEAKFKKGDESGAYRDLALAKAIVKPGFLDDLYNVPESLRAAVKTMRPQETWGEPYKHKETGQILIKSSLGNQKVLFTPPKPGKTEAEKEFEKTEKNLKSLAATFQKHLSTYNSASRGVDQFLPNPNAERIAKESFKRAITVATQYKAAGGDPKKLGITPKDVLAAMKAKTLTPEEAHDTLIFLFDFEE